MKLTPKKILEGFNRKELNKLSAIDQIFSLIENTDNLKARLEGVEILGKIGSSDNKVFDFLENLLISDSHEDVRNAAATILRESYSEKAFKPLKWALKHENSPSFLKTIVESLIDIIKEVINYQESREFLIEEINKVNNKEIKINFENLISKNDVESLTNDKLAEILIDGIILTHLEKLYGPVRFKLDDCKIVELNFNTSNITQIPHTIGYFNSLKKLSFWINRLEFLPKSIGNLTSLEHLNLRVNYLKKLPESIGNLATLKELDLFANGLNSIPQSITSLTSLEKLDLSKNELKSIPDSIGMLSSLKYLNLSRNQLSELPISMGSLSSLEYLNLFQNNLKTIPESMGSLSSLRVLILTRNELEHFPTSLNSLYLLKELHIGENKFDFDDLPITLKKLKNNGLEIIKKNYSRNYKS